MNTKITFHELAELMAEATSTTPRMCELFLRELFGTISQALIEGESVKVKGIGTFKITHVKPRKSTNVNTGEPIEVAGYKKLSFTPDKSLSDAVNQPFAQFETVMLSDEMTDEKLTEIDEQFPSALSDESVETATDAPIHQAVDSSLPDHAEILAPVFAEDELLPSQPDMPIAPPPSDLPEMQNAVPEPVMANIKPEPVKAETKPEPKKTENKSEPVKTETKPEPKKTESKPEPVKHKPMLVGIPIDGPSQPVPQKETEEEVEVSRRFYRPEPRNVYTPTPEQIEEAQRKPDRRWWWLIPALIAAVLAIALTVRGCDGQTEQEEQIVEQADTVVTLDDEATDKSAPDTKQASKPETKPEVKPEVKPETKSEVKSETKPETKPETKGEDKPKAKSGAVTDIVTSQIVLTTLAEKHYGSPWFWVYIYEENRNIISNPNNIRPGTRVVIPPAEKYGIDKNNKASLKKAQRKSWEILKNYQ